MAQLQPRGRNFAVLPDTQGSTLFVWVYKGYEPPLAGHTQPQWLATHNNQEARLDIVTATDTAVSGGALKQLPCQQQPPLLQTTKLQAGPRYKLPGSVGQQ
jgi:hypothetical protein